MLSLLGIVVPSLAAVLSSVLVWQLGTANRRQAAEQARRDAAQADRTARLDERKADRAELQSALDFWRTSFEAVTLDNKQLRAELEVERQAHRRTRTRVDVLERLLRRAGLEVPNGPTGEKPP